VLKLLNGHESTAKDVDVDGSKVDIMSLKLAHVSGNEVDGEKWLGKIRNKECHKSDVKGEDGFNAISHVEGGTSANSGCTTECS
jgi:hypothetical protein